MLSNANNVVNHLPTRNICEIIKIDIIEMEPKNPPHRVNYVGNGSIVFVFHAVISQPWIFVLAAFDLVDLPYILFFPFWLSYKRRSYILKRPTT